MLDVDSNVPGLPDVGNPILRGWRFLLLVGDHTMSRPSMLPLQRLCACGLSIFISCYEEWRQKAGEENKSPQNHWSCGLIGTGPGTLLRPFVGTLPRTFVPLGNLKINTIHD